MDAAAAVVVVVVVVVVWFMHACPRQESNLCTRFRKRRARSAEAPQKQRNRVKELRVCLILGCDVTVV
jgi:hypothetical protein